MARLAILLASLGWIIEGFELVGNYKFWHSISDSIVYDYSGMKNHWGYNTHNFYFTDRGITFYGASVLLFPPSGLIEFPGYMDFTVSYWYLRKDNRYTRVYTINFNSHSVILYFEEEAITGNLKITAIKAAASMTTIFVQTFPFQSLINKWALYTFKVTQNSINTESTFTIYVDLEYIHTFTDTGATLSSSSLLRIGASNYLYGILYEMWWHKDVSDINYLDYLLTSSSSCGCSYGYDCITSPTIKCLPNYDFKYNYQGDICSPGCPNSCNTKFECIENSKSECNYGLYHLESGNCLFYCPDNSCTFTNSLDLSCKEGYKKVSDNPPACIPSRCISYDSRNYRYTCYECELGYIPDSIGEYCICDIGYTPVSSDPLICIKIENCLSYMKVEDKYACSNCSEGYSIDSLGSCNQCESDYIQVLDEPFTCILKIDNCDKYKLNDMKWECELCEEGYSITLNKLCSINTDSDIEVCESNNYLSDGSCAECPENCTSCYILDVSIQCNKCKPDYTLIVINDDRVCVRCSVDNPICNVDSNGDDESESDISPSEENTENLAEDDSNNSTLKVGSETIKTGTIAITTISITIVSFNSALSLDANDLLKYLNDVKLLSYIIFLNIPIPYEVQVEKKSNLKTINKLNILSSIQFQDANVKDIMNDSIEDDYGFISRMTYQLIGLMIILIMNMLLYLLKRFGKGKLQALGVKGVQYFTYTVYIQYYMLIYLDLSYFTISKLLHVIAI